MQWMHEARSNKEGSALYGSKSRGDKIKFNPPDFWRRTEPEEFIEKPNVIDINEIKRNARGMRRVDVYAWMDAPDDSKIYKKGEWEYLITPSGEIYAQTTTHDCGFYWEDGEWHIS